MKFVAAVASKIKCIKEIKTASESLRDTIVFSYKVVS